jgi:transcriptional regulator with XRE-family HTH domain
VTRRTGSRRSADPLLKSIGEVLRRRRKGRGMSQQALAAAAGFTPGAVGELERGTRTIRSQEIVRLCLVLDIAVPDFLEEVKAAQVRALRPIEDHVRSGLANQRGDAQTTEPSFVLVAVGLDAASVSNAWIELLRNLIQQRDASA